MLVNFRLFGLIVIIVTVLAAFVLISAPVAAAQQTPAPGSVCVLAFDDSAIFVERGGYFVEQLLGHRRFTGREPVGDGPEIMARCFGFRSQPVIQAELDLATPGQAILVSARFIGG